MFCGWPWSPSKGIEAGSSLDPEPFAIDLPPYRDRTGASRVRLGFGDLLPHGLHDGGNMRLSSGRVQYVVSEELHKPVNESRQLNSLDRLYPSHSDFE